MANVLDELPDRMGKSGRSLSAQLGSEPLQCAFQRGVRLLPIERGSDNGPPFFLFPHAESPTEVEALNDAALARARQSSQYCAPTAGEDTMIDDRDRKSSNWLSLVLRDVQFWVPVAVLAAGLLVLRWIS